MTLTGPEALAWGRAKLAGLSIAGLVVLILLVAWALKSCQAPDQPKIDPKTQHTLDSLKATDSAFRRHQDSVITVVIHDTVRAAAANASADKSKASAVVIGRQADSLARLAALAATAQDSAREYHLAYDARTRERDTLLVTVARKDTAYQQERAARAALLNLYVIDTLRRTALQVANEGLARDIGKLDAPCRIIGPIRCPNRTVVGVAAAVIGVLAGRTSKP